jgi:hypothetical protein
MTAVLHSVPRPVLTLIHVEANAPQPHVHPYHNLLISLGFRVHLPSPLARVRRGRGRRDDKEMLVPATGFGSVLTDSAFDSSWTESGFDGLWSL